MRDVFCSMSTERSRKSSSLLRTVSQHRHFVSLVRVPWKISCTHVFSTGLPASLRWATEINRRETHANTDPPFHPLLSFPFLPPILKYTSHIVSDGVEEVVEKLMSILLLHIVKQPCRQERRDGERDGKHSASGSYWVSESHHCPS